MTTTALPDVPVRSMHDILNALDRYPEWRTALRQRLLAEELPELPAGFAKFAAETTRRFEVLTEQFDRMAGDVNTLKSDMGALKNDVGILTAAHAETEARRTLAFIVTELDLEYRRTVPRTELAAMARAEGADLRDSQMRSFITSDLIAEAVDAEGDTTFVAVEASYTGDPHNAFRALSHADLMERFTNKPCRAVIASVRNSDRLVKQIDSGSVARHKLKVRRHPTN